MRGRYGLARYLAGATAARTGDEASGPALVLLGLAATGSARSAGLVLGALTAATAVGGPVLGAVLDRAGRPPRILAGCLFGYAAGLALLTVVLARAQLWPAVLIAVAAGAFGPALSAGWSSRLATILPVAAVRRGYAADSASFAVAALAGPALAGALAAALHPTHAVLCAAALLLAATPLALNLPSLPAPISSNGATTAVPTRPVPRSAPRPAPAATSRRVSAPAPARRVPAVPWRRFPAVLWGRTPAVQSRPGAAPANRRGRTRSHHRAPSEPLTVALRRGARAVLADPALRSATLVSALSYLGVGAATVALPVLGATLTGRAGAGALLLAVTAGGALLSTAALARWPVPIGALAQVAAATAAMGAGLAILALARSWPVAVVGAAVVGVGDGPQLSALLEIRHRAAAPEMRTQIFAAGVSIKQAGYALGAVAAGVVAASSARPALVLAVLAQVAALVVAALPGNRRASIS